MKRFSNSKQITSREWQLNKNISLRYILNNNFRNIQFIKKWFNTGIKKFCGIIVFHEHSLQMFHSQIKCYEITAYAEMIWINASKNIVFYCVEWKFNETFIIGENPLHADFLYRMLTNLPFLWHILTSEIKNEPIFSCSLLNFMLWCFDDKYSRNEWAGSRDSKATNISSTYFYKKLV